MELLAIHKTQIRGGVKMTTLKHTKPTAKKVHHCEWCGGKIEIGEVYDYHAGLFCGDFFVTKSHLDCNRLVYKLDMFEESDDGLDSCGFWENIRYEFIDLSEKLCLSICRFDHLEEKEALQSKLEFVKSHHLKEGK